MHRENCSLGLGLAQELSPVKNPKAILFTREDCETLVYVSGNRRTLLLVRLLSFRYAIIITLTLPGVRRSIETIV